jgi:hypothetical protein
MYAQMRYFSKTIAVNTVDVYCGTTQEDCSIEVEFTSSSRVLKWSWFGRHAWEGTQK